MRFTNILLFLITISLPVLGQNGRIYEAEKATLSDSAKIISDKTASESLFVTIQKNGTIKWKVNTNNAGWYKLLFRYRAKGGDMAHKLDINGKKSGIGFTITNNWNNAYFSAYMQKGNNDILLSFGYGIVEVDYLLIPERTEYVLPSISPVNNVFYTSQPQSISLFTNASGRKPVSIRLRDIKINYTTTDYPYVDGAQMITISKEQLLQIPEGKHRFEVIFNDSSIAYSSINIKKNLPKSGLTIVMFNIEHGNAVLIILPGGKKLLIDSGKEEYARSIVMPFLDKQQTDTLHYYVVTHYHDDHCGAKDEIIQKYHVQHFYDYKSFKAGDTATWDKAFFTFLNTFNEGKDENDRSLSFLLKWNGFTYSHGSDNYAHTQDRILKKFGNKVFAEVFYANHHFHGSVNPEFIFKTNPGLVVVSAEQSVYARGAYTDMYKEQTEKVLYASHARLLETLLTLEVGTVVVRVQDSGEWKYETYMNLNDIYIP